MAPTPAEALTALRAAATRDGTPDAARRRALLRALEASLLARADEVVAALHADYGARCAEETLLSEVMVPLAAARYSRARLRRWMQPRRAPVPFHFQPARAWLEAVPKGVIGIMAPWNYPVQLVLMPLVDALAAGNRAVLKPSEATPRTAALLAEWLPAALGEDMVRVVQGGPEVAADFAAQAWDHLVFTGGTAVGRRVAQAAAANLVPVTLELGGKCAALVLPGADLARAARDILVAKQFNAGQTCVAPDTVLLVGHSAEAFAQACHASGLGACETAVMQPGRLAALAEGAALHPLAPTPGALALAFPPAGHALLEEEVFGPILPVQPCGGLEDALAWVNARPPALALYLFGATAAEEARVAAATRSGALVTGRALEYAAMPGIPFGGVGASGLGRRNAEAGFLDMSVLRARVRQGRFSLARLLDPPRAAWARDLVRKILR